MPAPQRDFPAPAQSTRSLWQAEGGGTVFDQNRVRRIGEARDALSLVEERVYELLWGAKEPQEPYRLSHYSLQHLAQEARINIKTVRELLPRLVDKGFIEIERPADVRRNIPTLYRVWSYGKVLERQRNADRIFIAKTGKGVFYVHPISVSIQTQGPAGLTPIGVSDTPRGLEAMPLADCPEPIGNGWLEPMGVSSPAGSLTGQIATLITTALQTAPDEQTIQAMIAECHRHAVETTGEPADAEDLLYFTRTKAQTIRASSNIRNHLAVLRKAVPQCFLGEAYRTHREAERRRKSEGGEDR